MNGNGSRNGGGSFNPGHTQVGGNNHSNNPPSSGQATGGGSHSNGSSFNPGHSQVGGNGAGNHNVNGAGANASHQGTGNGGLNLSHTGNNGRSGSAQLGNNNVHTGLNHSANGQYNGNRLNIGNHNVNLGNSGYRPSYSNHGFYHGYWNNSFNRGWYGRPYFWGLGGWGLGRIGYNSGYYNYYNPYCYYPLYLNNQVYNYQQPIPVVMNNLTPSAEAEQAFSAAREAFYAADYPAALRNVDAAIRLTPGDAVMHEFRALTLFALGQYQESAAVVHSILAVGPGWDWPTMRSLYPALEPFVAQLRTLEQSRNQSPERADLRFLLAYLYISLGHNDEAAVQLQRVVKLKPEDEVARQILGMLNPAGTSGSAPTTDRPPLPGKTGMKSGDLDTGSQSPDVTPVSPAKPAAKPIDPTALIGDWSANRADSMFNLSLKADGTFTWKFTEKEKTESFSGKYMLTGNLLVLERTDGGALVATLTSDGEGKFNFKLVGTDSADQGLNFAKPSA